MILPLIELVTPDLTSRQEQPNPSQNLTIPKKNHCHCQHFAADSQVLSVFMEVNNSILCYECCFIFHFLLEPSREKHFCLSHSPERGGQAESVRWLIFHSNGHSMAQIVGHYPKKSILPGCFTILHFRRWITWFLSLLFWVFFGEIFN